VAGTEGGAWRMAKNGGGLAAPQHASFNIKLFFIASKEKKTWGFICFIRLL